MHEQFLLAALKQAWLGRGVCAPNPSVGAVAVHNGQIIAQSWHRGAGTPHAEQLLLQQLPKNIPDITLYVTLEPCNHWGKTPPCSDAIVSYGVKQVVYAYRDPNPIIIANDTPGQLAEQDIEVLHYPLPEIDAFYQSYHYWVSTRKPWVTAKIAQTLDGKIAGPQGNRAYLSNELCAEFTHLQRSYADIILTTARTINLDDPLLTARVSGLDRAKPVAIIDGHGSINKESKVFTTAEHCHIYYGEQHSKPAERQNTSYHAMPATQGQLDLAAVITHLGHLGYHDVWVEAGGYLFSSLHQSRLVNKTHIYIVPKILGEAAVAAYHHAEMFNQANKISWQAMGDNMLASLDWVDVE